LSYKINYFFAKRQTWADKGTDMGRQGDRDLSDKKQKQTGPVSPCLTEKCNEVSLK